MTFAVQAETYDRFVGRYSADLGRALAERAGVRPGVRALDVGAGSGKLTGVLADIVGEENVAAVDPSEPFVAALGERFPAADVRRSAAESLPFGDGSFDVVLAQLVINFMTDPEAGAAEMARVVRAGGTVAGAVWDYRGGMTMLSVFWEAAAAIDERGAAARDERTRSRFADPQALVDLLAAAGLRDVEGGQLVVSASYSGFDDLWEPFLAGVGPAGDLAASLDPDAQAALREEYRRRLGSPAGPFELQARAWYAAGRR
jgi:SAM-dependent methyltransferase